MHPTTSLGAALDESFFCQKDKEYVALVKTLKKQNLL